MNDGASWMLNGEDATLACGSENQISGLVAYLDKLRESQKDRAASLRRGIDDLQKDFEKMISDLDYAIASRRLRKGCDLVPFWRGLLPFF